MGVGTMRDYNTRLRDLLSSYHGGLEHLKIETRLRDERFESLKGEYEI
jgi:hypothetical protein